MLEVFAKGEYHVARIEALTALAIDQRFQIDVGRVGLAYGDAGSERARRIEILREGEIERSAGQPARGPDAPIAEHRDAPNVIGQLRRLQVDAALAEHDRNLAFVVQATAALGIDELAVGADDLAGKLPETPEPGFADFLVSVALIRPAPHLDRHCRRVVGEIPAGASNARIIGPRRVQADSPYRVHERLAAGPEFVLSLAEKIVECLLRVFERTRAALDQTGEIRGHQRLGHLQRTGLTLPFAKVFGASIGQIYDVTVMQCAGSLIRTEYDDFHWMQSLPS